MKRSTRSPCASTARGGRRALGLDPDLRVVEPRIVLDDARDLGLQPVVGARSGPHCQIVDDIANAGEGEDVALGDAPCGVRIDFTRQRDDVLVRARRDALPRGDRVPRERADDGEVQLVVGARPLDDAQAIDDRAHAADDVRHLHRALLREAVADGAPEGDHPEHRIDRDVLPRHDGIRLKLAQEHAHDALVRHGAAVDGAARLRERRRRGGLRRRIRATCRADRADRDRRREPAGRWGRSSSHRSHRVAMRVPRSSRI
jgi:hypothetical protein